MTWTFLWVAYVVALQRKQIDEFGGSHGLRDYGLLESAVNRARNKVEYEEDTTVAEVAASLSYGLIKNHAFIDGNKRIGLLVLVTFLDLNGFEVNRSLPETASVVQQVAASLMSEAAWTAWVRQWAVSIGT